MIEILIIILIIILIVIKMNTELEQIYENKVSIATEQFDMFCIPMK
jgi:hypothetical protein